MNPLAMISELTEFYRAGAADCRAAALAALALVLVICGIRYIVAVLRPSIGNMRGSDDN